jgi:hypothetical protein
MFKQKTKDTTHLGADLIKNKYLAVLYIYIYIYNRRGGNFGFDVCLAGTFIGFILQGWRVWVQLQGD